MSPFRKNCSLVNTVVNTYFDEESLRMRSNFRKHDTKRSDVLGGDRFCWKPMV
jgi:hypothetical protein